MTGKRLSRSMLNQESGSISLDPKFFLFLLHKELASAERYQHYVSILLFKPDGLAEQGSSLDRLARVLATYVRKSDYVGRIRKGTLGIILSHTSIEGARTVLERLRFETLCLSGGPQKTHLKASYAVYPSEANLLESLCDLAIQRLTDQEYNALLHLPIP